MGLKMKITTTLFNTGVFSVFAVALVCGIVMFSAENSQAAEEQKRAPEATLEDIAIPPASDPVHQIIREQLAAIQKRDADKAFALTTDKFHDKYDSALDFLAKMRIDHRTIYNYKRYSFLEPENDREDRAVQRVRITDRYGHSAIVIYRLVQQPGGMWLIDSFMVLESDAQPI